MARRRAADIPADFWRGLIEATGRQRAFVTTRPPILLELGPDSDVAVRDSDDGALRCVGCSLRYGEGDFVAPARREMVRHLLLHKEEGERVPNAAIEELAAEGSRP